MKSLAGAEFLDEIQTKVLRVFLLAIQSHLNSFALLFYFFELTQPLTVSSVLLYCTLYKRKEENLIENHTFFPMVSEINTEFSSLENTQDYA
jgi:hypothetical protein